MTNRLYKIINSMPTLRFAENFNQDSENLKKISNILKFIYFLSLVPKSAVYLFYILILMWPGCVSFYRFHHPPDRAGSYPKNHYLQIKKHIIENFFAQRNLLNQIF